MLQAVKYAAALQAEAERSALLKRGSPKDHNAGTDDELAQPRKRLFGACQDQVSLGVFTWFMYDCVLIIVGSRFSCVSFQKNRLGRMDDERMATHKATVQFTSAFSVIRVWGAVGLVWTDGCICIVCGRSCACASSLRTRFLFLFTESILDQVIIKSKRSELEKHRDY